MAFQIDPARNGSSQPQLKVFYEHVLASVRAVPGVTSAGYAWVPVLSGREADWDVVVEGLPRDGHDTQTYVNGLSNGYWRTMGLQLLDGRDFDAGDGVGRPKVAIVNRKFARDFCPGRSPIGMRMTLDTGSGATLDTEIVGLVEDSVYEGPPQGIRRQAFFPLAQMNQSVGTTFYLRVQNDPAAILATLRRKVHELDPALPVFEMKTLDRQLDETLGTERLTSALSLSFGVLATLLAAIGLYGVMALTVARRTREIGLRMALGARRGAIVWPVMREALGVLAVGLGLGVP